MSIITPLYYCQPKLVERDSISSRHLSAIYWLITIKYYLKKPQPITALLQISTSLYEETTASTYLYLINFPLSFQN